MNAPENWPLLMMFGVLVQPVGAALIHLGRPRSGLALMAAGALTALCGGLIGITVATN